MSELPTVGNAIKSANKLANDYLTLDRFTLSDTEIRFLILAEHLAMGLDGLAISKALSKKSKDFN